MIIMLNTYVRAEAQQFPLNVVFQDNTALYISRGGHTFLDEYFWNSWNERYGTTGWPEMSLYESELGFFVSIFVNT